jgi:hypothetical protein
MRGLDFSYGIGYSPTDAGRLRQVIGAAIPAALGDERILAAIHSHAERLSRGRS